MTRHMGIACMSPITDHLLKMIARVLKNQKDRITVDLDLFPLFSNTTTTKFFMDGIYVFQ